MNNDKYIKIAKFIEDRENNGLFAKIFFSIIIVITLFLFLQGYTNDIGLKVFIMGISFIISFIVLFYLIITNNILNLKGNINILGVFSKKEKNSFLAYLEAEKLEGDFFRNGRKEQEDLLIEELEEKYPQLKMYIEENYDLEYIEKKLSMKIINEKGKENIINLFHVKFQLKSDIKSISKKYYSEYGEQTIESLEKKLKELEEKDSIFIKDEIKMTEKKLKYLKNNK